MKHILFSLGSIIVLSMVSVTISPAQLQQQRQQLQAAPPAIPAPSAPVPRYSTLSWTQILPPAARFTVLSDWGNAAVLDHETGLVWERMPDTVHRIWPEAKEYCLVKTVGYRWGWRLPTIQELGSLIDMTVTSGVRLPPGHPFVINEDAFWSATLSLTTPNEAWAMDTKSHKDGRQIGKTRMNEKWRAWCVRGGLGNCSP